MLVLWWLEEAVRVKAKQSPSKFIYINDICLPNRTDKISSNFSCSSKVELFHLVFIFASSSTITLVSKKRKRNASSDHSDEELNPSTTPGTQEEDLSQVTTFSQAVTFRLDC